MPEPPRASYQEALNYLLEANKLNKGTFMMCKVRIADMHLHLKNKKESRVWLDEALNMPLNSFDDVVALDKARKLQSKF